MKNSKSQNTRFRSLDTLASLMDNRFRIPGTNIHFGFDALIGLIPGIGDLISFLISAHIISVATKNGASGYVRSRMILNVAVDTIIGAIPLIGDIFDVGFQANQKNMRLLHQHFNEGKHKGSAKKVMIPAAIAIMAIIAVIVWGFYKLIVWIF